MVLALKEMIGVEPPQCSHQQYKKTPSSSWISHETQDVAIVWDILALRKSYRSH
jgi:hypothetical protein